MNTQWLTTLITNMKSQVDGELRARGLRLDPVDLAALIEDISPRASKKALSYALDVFKSFTRGMGLRVAQLSDSQIEVVLPQRPHNLTETNEIHEGVLVGAALEAARILWSRHAPLGQFSLRATSVQMDLHRLAKEQLRLKAEFSESLKEALLSELRRQSKAHQTLQVKIYDSQDQSVGDVLLQLELSFQPSLTSSQVKDN